ncbi:hypothetical protein NVP1185O_04 [Vibrio phage 1.185.O._10N.286.49.C2]|nr:hypothetical protein NVP1185O_04 [Vibrio phage 1.185.O._10N.286.49.C2]
MCGGSPSAPAAPATLPEAPTAPDTSASGEGQADRDKRRRAAASGQDGGTILTGSRGVTNSGATATKTLLGQ